MNRRENGFATALSIMAMFLAMMLGMSMLAVTEYDLNSADRLRNQTEAFNLAESGADRALRWMKSSGYPPAMTTDPFGGPQSLGDGSYSVSIVPDPGNSSALLKSYTLVSNGTCHGYSDQVQVYIREQSFGRYVYFTDAEVSSISKQPIWFFPGDRIRGPAHSNNAGGSYFHISWDATATQPIFDDMVTSAGDQIVWAPQQPVGSLYNDVFQGGMNSYKLGSDAIPLPSSAAVQQIEAWGSDTGFPTTDGVYVNPGGGIYIHGDAAAVLKDQGPGVQEFVITQGSDTYDVIADANMQTTTVTHSSPMLATTTQVVDGPSTGVLYATGNLTSLSGIVSDNKLGPSGIESRNAWTIAADAGAGRSITLTAPLTTKDPYDPGFSPNDNKNLKPGTLGLYAQDIVVGSQAPSKMEIDAVMLAGTSSMEGGNFYVQNWDTKTPTGTLTVMGGVIQQARGPVGTFNGSLIKTGYAKNYWYDERLVDRPPPYFPTTGLYDTLSWRRITQ